MACAVITVVLFIVVSRAVEPLPFPQAVIAVVGLGALLGISSAHGCSRRGQRSSGHQPELGAGFLCAALLGVPLILWTLLAMVTDLILALLGQNCSFETVFSTLVYACVPIVAWWGIESLLSPRREIYKLKRFVTILVSGWSIHRLFWVLQAISSIPLWAAALASLPVFALLLTNVVQEFRGFPNSIISTYDWKRRVGERVVVFHSANAPPDEIQRITEECDRTLARAAEILRVRPLSFKVYVFLFPDQELFQRIYSPSNSHQIHGFALPDSICLKYDNWNSIRGTVAHEFAHVLRTQRISSNLQGLLDEGLAEEVQCRVFPGTAFPPLYALPVPLRHLANATIFYEFRDADEAEYPSSHSYSHAHSFVEYLWESHGIENLKLFCVEAATGAGKTQGDRFQKAAQKIYGMTLKDLEAAWARSIALRIHSMDQQGVSSSGEKPVQENAASEVEMTLKASELDKPQDGDYLIPRRRGSRAQSPIATGSWDRKDIA